MTDLPTVELVTRDLSGLELVEAVAVHGRRLELPLGSRVAVEHRAGESGPVVHVELLAGRVRYVDRSLVVAYPRLGVGGEEGAGPVCNQCGHRNPAGSNFCSSCGAALLPPAGVDRTTSTVVFSPEIDGDDLDPARSRELLLAAARVLQGGSVPAALHGEVGGDSVSRLGALCEAHALGADPAVRALPDPEEDPEAGL